MKIKRRNMMINLLLVVLAASSIGAKTLVRKLTKVDTYNELAAVCNDEFRDNRDCPNDICHLACEGGIDYDGCDLICTPRDCVELDSSFCPKDTCDLLKGCDGVNVCYYKSERQPGSCGDIAYAGDDVACCEGFEKRCGIEFFDGTCDMSGEGSIYGVPICIPCGDGICNQFENRCNCPEDCKQ